MGVAVVAAQPALVVSFPSLIVWNTVAVTIIYHHITELLTQLDHLDQQRVHALLQQVDHQEARQHQDLRHRQPGVRERARRDGCCRDLKIELVSWCGHLCSLLDLQF